MAIASLADWIDSGLTGLFVLTGAIMTFFILLQEGKGGGLTAFGGTKAAGVEGVTNPIRRATVYMAALFFTLAIILGIIHAPRPSVTIGPAAPAAGPSAPVNTSPAPEVKTMALPAEKPEEAAKAAEAPKKEEPKKEEPKKAEEPKKEEAKKADEPKKEEAKKADEPKN